MSFPPDGPLSAPADSFLDNEIPQSMSADQATMLCAPCSPITPVADEIDESDDDYEEDFTCTICIMEVEDGDKVGALNCHHIFHVQCLKEWIKRKNVCPLCQVPDIASPRPGNPDTNSPPRSPWPASGSAPAIISTMATLSSARTARWTRTSILSTRRCQDLFLERRWEWL